MSASDHSLIRWIRRPATLHAGDMSFVFMKPSLTRRGGVLIFLTMFKVRETSEMRTVKFTLAAGDQKIEMQVTNDDEVYETIDDIPRYMVETVGDFEMCLVGLMGPATTPQ
jgi:hypothetical protein